MTSSDLSKIRKQVSEDAVSLFQKDENGEEYVTLALIIDIKTSDTTKIRKEIQGIIALSGLSMIGFYYETPTSKHPFFIAAKDKSRIKLNATTLSIKKDDGSYPKVKYLAIKSILINQFGETSEAIINRFRLQEKPIGFYL